LQPILRPATPAADAKFSPVTVTVVGLPTAAAGGEMEETTTDGVYVYESSVEE
jgi:hypothetical protein